MSTVAEFNPSQIPERAAASTDTVQENEEAALRIDALSQRADVPLLHGSAPTVSENSKTINTEKTVKGTKDEAYTKAAEAARRAMDQSIKQSTVNKKDIAEHFDIYEKETIQQYRTYHPTLSEEDLREKIAQDSRHAHLAYDEFVAWKANEQKKLAELGDMLFQTETITEQELSEIEAVRKRYEGSAQWLKAPNAKESNLSEQQWLQVRTDSFKKWFGDWENNPENASKVIDENGEPLVVYHGTAYTFDTFSTPLNMERIFLTKNKTFAHKYGTISLPLFVNARTLLQVDYKGNNAFEELEIQGTILESIEDVAEYARDNGYSGVCADNVTDAGTFSSRIEINDEVIVFKPNQLKSAVDNKGSFDPDNDNIYFQTETITEEQRAFQETAAQYRKDINRYFAGTMKSHETITVCKKTPAVLRAVGFEDNAITVTKSQLDHIREGHIDITQEILNTLPEEILDPIAVFNSDNKRHPNNKIIVTQHILKGKPVVAIIELGKKENNYIVNSIRSVYEKNATEEHRIENKKIMQDWIDAGLLTYIDDTRVDEWLTSTGMTSALTHKPIRNPFATSIGKTEVNVKGVITKTALIGDNAAALYFQVEKEFFDEVKTAGDAKSAQMDLEKIIVGLDPEQAMRFFYTDAQDRAKRDKAYRDALDPALEKALQKDIKDEKIKDATFLKMMEHKEALRTFMQQYLEAEKAGLEPELFRQTGGLFATIAYNVTQGKPLTEKQRRLALSALTRQPAAFRNIFAQANDYSALRTLTEAETAWSEAYAKVCCEDKANTTGAAKSRAEIQDEMFLEEVYDDEKLAAFLKEAARIFYFDFEHFQPSDESELSYGQDMKRLQGRIYTLMRNKAWKSQLTNAFHNKEFSDHAIKNIRGQMRNAARTYRDLYADIMKREDMIVKDADSTDVEVKTKLKSRPLAGVKLDELRLETMSAVEKERLKKAIQNDEMEERVHKGTITVGDVGKIDELIKSKNENIKDLKKQIKELKEDEAHSNAVINKLETRLKNERVERKVMADTIRARDVALKAVMKRIDLKSCNVEEINWLREKTLYKRKSNLYNLIFIYKNSRNNANVLIPACIYIF